MTFFERLRLTFKSFVNPLKCANTITSLEKENAALRQIAYDKIPETHIVDFLVQEHFGVQVNVEGGFCRIIAELLVKEFIETGAVNYVEMSFTSQNLQPGEHFVLTLQKSSGLTPHQKIKKLEKELAEEKSWKNW